METDPADGSADCLGSPQNLQSSSLVSPSMGPDPKTGTVPGAIPPRRVHPTPPGIGMVHRTQEERHLPSANQIGSPTTVSTPNPGRSEGAEPDRVGGWKQGRPEGGPCGTSCVTDPTPDPAPVGSRRTVRRVGVGHDQGIPPASPPQNLSQDRAVLRSTGQDFGSLVAGFGPWLATHHPLLRHTEAGVRGTPPPPAVAPCEDVTPSPPVTVPPRRGTAPLGPSSSAVPPGTVPKNVSLIPDPAYKAQLVSKSQLKAVIAKVTSLKAKLALTRQAREAPVANQIRFIELFPGEAGLSERVRACGVPTETVPDVRYGGPDLATPEGLEVVRRLVLPAPATKTVLHAAPPCAFMSRVRDRSILTRVRSPLHPEGLPGLPWLQAERVANSNALADATADLASANFQQGGHSTIENPASSYIWLRPKFQDLISQGWILRILDACQFGAPWKKPTGVLCSPGWAPNIWKRCTWIPSKNRFSCGHTAAWGAFPHASLGRDYPTAVAAEYPEGLTRHWAQEIRTLSGQDSPITIINPDDTECRQRVRRHISRGLDPDTAREVREAENVACRAGLRNPHLCTEGGARTALRATMTRVATLLKMIRARTPGFQNLTECFGENPPRLPPHSGPTRSSTVGPRYSFGRTPRDHPRKACTFVMDCRVFQSPRHPHGRRGHRHPQVAPQRGSCGIQGAHPFRPLFSSLVRPPRFLHRRSGGCRKEPRLLHGNARGVGLPRPPTSPKDRREGVCADVPHQGSRRSGLRSHAPRPAGKRQKTESRRLQLD